MNRIFPYLVFLFLSGIFLSSCSSSNGIDDFYTFNLAKSQSFPISTQVSTTNSVTVPYSIVIDSSDFVTSSTLSTSRENIRSVKLTKIVFSPSDGSYPMTNLDSLSLVVSADSLSDLVLATYTGSADSTYLTNADFATYFKKPSVHYSITYKANKAPAQDITVATQTTFVFSAAPLQ